MTVTGDRFVDLRDRPAGRRVDGDRPLAEILSALGNDVSDLVQAQLDLAKLELREDAGRAGRAAAMGGAAAAVAVSAVVLIGAAAAWAIAEAWPPWSGFLIVGVVYAAIAAGLAMRARRSLEPVAEGPTQTIDELQEDARWLRQHRS